MENLEKKTVSELKKIYFDLYKSKPRSSYGKEELIKNIERFLFARERGEAFRNLI